MLNTVLVPINPEGGRFIAIFAVLAAVLFFIWEPLGWVGVVLTLWCAYFFRDPDRYTPTRKGLMVSPADGVVQYVDQQPLPKELEMGDEIRNRICVFMNVFNVHVNRVPTDGVISKLAYVPGKFVNASLDKASEFNERQCVALKMDDGREVAFVQIAGLVARRIKCDIKEEQPVKAGERFGLIRFGSRVDIYLPEGVEPMVSVGQITTAGETVIADLESKEQPRDAQVR